AEELEVERKALTRDDPKSGAKQLTENEITSATTLSFCTYELIRSPGIQQRLHDEVVAAFHSNGEMEYDVLARLPYLDAVVSETLRMHSPGVKVTVGQNIDIPIYAIHHCEEFYPEPFKFDPDPIMPENRYKVLPYTYLPFGAGPRNCIGMRFSLLEVKLGLAHKIKNYRFSICPETDVPVQYKRMLRIGAPKRTNVRIEKRV
ncbi:unnamed protein product, partial [Oppiella nova]